MKNRIFVLDSNIWISYIIKGQLHILAESVLKLNLEVVTCLQLIQEISGVLQRDKFKKYILKKDIKEALAIHLKIARFYEIEQKSTMLSDKKDNFLLDLYHSSSAACIVSGDKLLITEATQHHVNVITLEEFRKYLKEQLL